MKYSGIIKNDVVNGQDVCVSFWVQGCPHHCEGCHNPETWDFDCGIEKNEKELRDEILNAIGANGVIRNLSILGGEPLCEKNVSFVTWLLSHVKAMYPDIKTYVWSGYTFEELMDMTQPEDAIVRVTLQKIDYLIDGRFELDKRDISLPLIGSANQRIIDVQETIKKHEIVIHSLDNS